MFAIAADKGDANVSVIVCTRNRAKSLAKTIASIGRAEVPWGWNVELLVVDNGSTDETRCVVENFYAPALTVRYVYEPSVGLSRARNRAVVEAAAGSILFTDDDALVSRGWVSAMAEPLLGGRADMVGGPVELCPEILRPWLNSRLRGFLAEFSPGDTFGMLGANMGFKRNVWENVGGFPEELGAGRLGAWEEIVFYQLALKKGLKGESVGDAARVIHCPDPRRLTRKGFREAARKSGQSYAYARTLLGEQLEEFEWFRPLRAWLGLWILRMLDWRTLLLTNEPSMGELAQIERLGYMLQVKRMKGA